MRTAVPLGARSQFQGLLSAAVLVAAHACSAAPAPEPTAEPPPDTLTGTWRARARLQESGLSPFAVLTTEVWGNAAGGLKSRAWWNTLLEFGLELDTGRLGWWSGGSVLAQVQWVQNVPDSGGFDDYTGGFNPVSGIMAGDQLRVFNLHYRHSWREDALVLKLGQIAVDDDFMGSGYAGLFLNSAFGAMPSQVGTPLATTCGNPPAFPMFSVAAPGVFLSARPWEPLATQLALYYGRPGLDVPDNHGFDWTSQTPAELGLFWETSYSYRLGGRPAIVRFGLSYHTGPVDDFGAGAAQVPSATTQTVPSCYLIHDLAILTDAQGEPKVGGFVRGGITSEPDRSLVSAYVDGGLNWFAPLPGRPDDMAGLAVSHTRFGNAYRASTGPDGAPAAETTVELTYRAQLAPWLALQADVQFLFDPAIHPQSGSRETATILGLRAEARF